MCFICLPFASRYPDGTPAYGGYAARVTVHEHFVFHIPETLSSPGAAPLLCAGITTYKPFHMYPDKVQKGNKIGVVGLGGLGHLAVKWGKAFGCHVSVINNVAEREKVARELGADDYILSTDEKQLAQHSSTYDAHTLACRSAEPCSL